MAASERICLVVEKVKISEAEGKRRAEAFPVKEKFSVINRGAWNCTDHVVAEKWQLGAGGHSRRK